MSEPEKKKTATKIYHYIFWALILVPVAVAAILPATGPYVLLDEGMRSSCISCRSPFTWQYFMPVL